MAASTEQVQSEAPPEVTEYAKLKSEEQMDEKRTSDYYKIADIPERFNNPSEFLCFSKDLISYRAQFGY